MAQPPIRFEEHIGKRGSTRVNRIKGLASPELFPTRRVNTPQKGGANWCKGKELYQLSYTTFRLWVDSNHRPLDYESNKPLHSAP